MIQMVRVRGGQFGCCRVQDLPGMAESACVRRAVRVHEIICQILRSPFAHFLFFSIFDTQL